jgi:hypothetical protein
MSFRGIFKASEKKLQTYDAAGPVHHAEISDLWLPQQ